MKKPVLFLLPLLILGCSSCKEEVNKTYLTYGTLISETAIQISSAEFTTKVENNENFLLAIYPKDSSCWCWKHFEGVIDQAVKDYHYSIYKFYAHDVESNPTMKEIGKFLAREDAPTFYVVNNKDVAIRYNYNSSNPFFTNISSFMNEINKVTIAPTMMMSDKAIYDEQIKTNGLFYFIRNSCSDCSYATPKMIMPYLISHEASVNKIYVIDLQDLYDQDKQAYQEAKDYYQLSFKGNATFGFDTGVVPTFQYYKNSSLFDMAIAFNDGTLTYNAEDNCYNATNSYYNKERNKHHHYLKNVTFADISAVKIAENDTIPYKENRYWKQDSAAVYYTDIINNFLATYLI